MIEFMVVALPRSATTWTSNWLTTDDTLCYHDLSNFRHFSDWDSIVSNKSLGVSDTGICLFPEFVNAHPARKVILHRDLSDVNRSLDAIGYPRLDDRWVNALGKIHGKHFCWENIFAVDTAKEIYEYLLQKPFDRERWEELTRIEMQPQFSGITVNVDVAKKMLDQVRGL